MRRCVIIAGADIRRYDRIRGYLRDDDFVICCDSGLRHRERLGVNPDLAVGDFDSYDGPSPAAETIVLPCEKDDTDTVYAVKEALRRGFRDFLLLGVIGGRFDHTMGNIGALLMLDSAGAHGVALDDYSEMEVVSRGAARIDDRYPFFSLLNMDGCARGVRIVNAKYPLRDAEITCEYQYGISNEVLPGEVAQVSVEEGRLLLVRVLP